MKIESILRRPGGSQITMPTADGKGKVYHFVAAPDDERHIAEVGDDDHIARFLRISEGFRIAKSAESAKEQPQPSPAPTLTPTVSPLPAGNTMAPDPGASVMSPNPGATEAPAMTNLAFTIAPTTADDLDTLSKADLLERAKNDSIDVSDKLPKPAIIAQMRAAYAAKKGTESTVDNQANASSKGA